MILQNAITSIISPELSMIKMLLKYPQFAVQPIHYYYEREVENQTTNKHLGGYRWSMLPYILQ